MLADPEESSLLMASPVAPVPTPNWRKGLFVVCVTGLGLFLVSTVVAPALHPDSDHDTIADAGLTDVVEESLVPQASEEEFKIGLCYGIIYGDNNVVDRLKFWVEYHRAIGIDTVFAFTHPLLNKSAFEMEGFHVEQWDHNYSTAGCDDHKGNHWAAMRKCVTSARDYKWVFVLDTDEFLWFNAAKYSSLRQMIIKTSRNHTLSEVKLERQFYNIHICENVESGETVWDVPYRKENADAYDSDTKYAIQPKYVGEKSVLKAHSAKKVDLKSIRLKQTHAHVKHFRGFAQWNGSCDSALGEHRVCTTLWPDPKNPCVSDWKKKFDANFTFQRDDELNQWQDFVEKHDLRQLMSPPVLGQ